MSSQREQARTILVPTSMALPDNTEWTNRFSIKSESSTRLYTIAQHKTKKHWGCSCPGWRTRRYCKHLRALELPTHEKALNVEVEVEVKAEIANVISRPGIRRIRMEEL